MVIKLYISGISGNKEVKKKQQRVQMILDSKQIDYEAIDITEPGKEKDKEFMQQNGKVRESLGKYPLPPQIFNDEDFCGDYEDFDLANEVDELEKFLHIETIAKDSETDGKQDKETNNYIGSKVLMDSLCNPYEYHTFKITFDSVNGLKEQIINTNDVAEENIEAGEVKKSEVNGECEAVLKSSSENVTENVETSPENVGAPEKEESSTQENKAEDDKGEEGNVEKVEDNVEGEAEGEAVEKGEDKEEVEVPKEEKVENEEETSSEEKKMDEEKENKEKEEEVESEKEEEKESDNESPQEEKSQED